MGYETLANRNTTEGLHVLFVYANDVTSGLFMPLLFFCLFSILCIGTYLTQVRLRGQGDFPGALAASGFVTVILAIVMATQQGLVNVTTLGLMVAIEILFVIGLFLTGDD